MKIVAKLPTVPSKIQPSLPTTGVKTVVLLEDGPVTLMAKAEIQSP